MADRRRIETFNDFWPHYLAAHADPATRAMHVVGTAVALAFACLLWLTGNLWFLAAAAVAGYGSAWLSHALFEGNRPQTFSHPVWSLLGDFRMFTLACTGRLDAEFRHYKIGPR